MNNIYQQSLDEDLHSIFISFHQKKNKYSRNLPNILFIELKNIIDKSNISIDDYINLDLYISRNHDIVNYLTEYFIHRNKIDGLKLVRTDSFSTIPNQISYIKYSYISEIIKKYNHFLGKFG